MACKAPPYEEEQEMRTRLKVKVTATVQPRTKEKLQVLAEAGKELQGRNSPQIRSRGA